MTDREKLVGLIEAATWVPEEYVTGVLNAIDALGYRIVGPELDLEEE